MAATVHGDAATRDDDAPGATTPPSLALVVEQHPPVPATPVLRGANTGTPVPPAVAARGATGQTAARAARQYDAGVRLARLMARSVQAQMETGGDGQRERTAKQPSLGDGIAAPAPKATAARTACKRPATAAAPAAAPEPAASKSYGQNVSA